VRIYEAAIQYRLVNLGEQSPLDSPAKIVEYMKHAFDEDPTVEWFFTVLLNRKNRPISRVMISKGTANASLVHPREVFKSAILASACSIVAVHNHPSGDPSPSCADIKVTRQLKEAANVVDITLLDHIIIGHVESDPARKGYYSFQESGLL